jgi:hypothetical protein
MASDWKYTVTLLGSNALKTTLVYNFHSEEALLADALAALVTASGLVNTSLGLLSDANIYNESLTYLMGGSPALPADADITDEAVVITFLTGAGVIPKYHPIRIPAPVSDLFESDLITVDETLADLITYIALLEASWQVSDGESIDTEVDNGIASGWWRSVKKSGK